MKKIILGLSFSFILLVLGCTKTPEACFTINKGKLPKVNEEIQFDASCSKDAVSFLWEFGDGNNGSEISTKHKYSIAGNYIVKLTVTNKSKSAIQSQSIYISQ